LLKCSMLQTQQIKDLSWLYLKKWWIFRVENAIDEEEFDQFDVIPPFIASVIKPRIPSANKAQYLRNDHHEKVKNFKKPRSQREVPKWLCKICSMCENMVICVKIWLSIDICVKYDQYVKIWLLCFWCPVCSFWRPCVQFLLNTILNLVIV
jgi:hypothetical protein